MDIYKKTHSGFTLLEIIIYVAILAIILFFISGFIFNGVTSSSKIETWQDVNTSGGFVMNQILESVQSSQGID
jgi:prepilin-type N-terminal cleavage/methylation domain-containing protein